MNWVAYSSRSYYAYYGTGLRPFLIFVTPHIGEVRFGSSGVRCLGYTRGELQSLAEDFVA